MSTQPTILTGQIAPYTQEGEEATLGSCLVDPEAYARVSQFLNTEDFYLLRNSYIWEAMNRLTEKKVLIDFITIVDELKVMNRLDDIGGQSYLLHLVNSTPTSVNAEVYGHLVERTAVRRRLLIAADEIKALAMDEQLTVEKVTADAESRLARVTNIELGSKQERLADIMARQMGEVEYRMTHPEEPPGLPSGFRDIDEVTGGYFKGDLTLIAARPGAGKTSYMVSAILNMMRLGLRIGFATQEMNRDKIALKLAAMESGINSQKIRLGRLSEAEYSLYVRAVGNIDKYILQIDDANRLTPDRLRGKALRWMMDLGLDILFVDYLQILSSGGLFRPSDRVAEVGYFARELKQLARELKIPVVSAAQLSRELEKRADKRPQLSDLRESGELEQEADVVQFIYRDVMYNEATEFPSRADIIFAKNREGATGSVSLHFEKTTTRFSDQKTATIDLSSL